jgi:RNA polymerase sigma-70 factor (ECF subfamily)
MTNEQLMQFYVETDNQEAYAELYKRFEKPLYGCARKWVRNETHARDITQNTLNKIFTKKHLYQIGAPFSTWLFTILRHESVDCKRRILRNQQHITNDYDLDLVLSRPESEIHNVEKYIEALPDPFRECAQMYFLDRIKYEDIATKLNVPPGTVKSRLHTARLRMREVQ